MNIVSTFIHAANEYAIKGRKTTPAEFDSRLTICKTCPFYSAPQSTFDSTLALATGYKFKCNKCGCNGLKLTWTTEKCPMLKWNKID